MKKLKSGDRFILSVEPKREEDGWWLILDDAYIEKYNCRIHVDGLDFSEFVRTGQKMLAFHDSYSQLPLGDWEYKVENNKLYGKPNFASDIYPYAAVCEKMANTKSPVTGHYYLNAVSAGLTPLEVVERQGDEAQDVTKATLNEISMVIFGAHPKAGRGLSLTLDAAVADGTITESDAAIMGESVTANGNRSDLHVTVHVENLDVVKATVERLSTEGAALRTELETLRTENARLQAELTARPKPQGVRVLASQPINPGGIAVNPEHLSATVNVTLAATLAAAMDRVMRRMTGKLPD
jgi:hypothetical protein